jgi:excisionase family DNA binding protein
MTTTTEIPNKFLTVREVADILRVTPRTVYGYLNDGLHYNRIGRRSIRITRSHLLSFVQRGSRAA